MTKAPLLDLGGTVLAEQSYDLVSGFYAVSDRLLPNITFADLCDAIKIGQIELSEFSVLNWIKENSLKPEEPTKACDIELALWENTVSLEPIEGVADALENLRYNGVRVGAISNAIFSSGCISRELRNHDLLRHFEFVISSADFGLRKSATTIFISASVSYTHLTLPTIHLV